MLLIEYFFGLEGNGLLASSLRHRELVLSDVVAAKGYEAAEWGYFRRAAQPQPAGAAAKRAPAGAGGNDEFVGLSPEGEAEGRTVAIVDYGSGNLHSARKAFERAARGGGTGHTILVTADPQAIRAAERIVLPGVGAFADCRRGLAAIPGMVETLQER